jgi:hypothetical protein
MRKQTKERERKYRGGGGRGGGNSRHNRVMMGCMFLETLPFILVSQAWLLLLPFPLLTLLLCWKINVQPNIQSTVFYIRLA